MGLKKDYPDLQELLDEALGRVDDTRRVWYELSTTYDSYTTLGKRVLLGGAASPYFLRKASKSGPRNEPWTLGLGGETRLLIAERMTGVFEDWLPFLGALIEACESLLVLTPGVDGHEVLLGFGVNTMTNTFLSCPILPLPDHAGNLHGFAERLSAGRHGLVMKRLLPYLPQGSVPSAQIREQLPALKNVVVRRDATVADTSDESLWSGLVCDVATIHVGGRHYDDQEERVCALAEAIQNHSDTRPTA